MNIYTSFHGTHWKISYTFHMNEIISLLLTIYWLKEYKYFGFSYEMVHEKNEIELRVVGYQHLYEE